MGSRPVVNPSPSFFLIPILWYNTSNTSILETKTLHLGHRTAHQLSITEDMAIRIVLHSAEVIHSTHTIRKLTVSATSRHTRCMRSWVTDHSLLLAHPSTGPCPHEHSSNTQSGLPSKPWVWGLIVFPSGAYGNPSIPHNVGGPRSEVVTQHTPHETKYLLCWGIPY